jgi:hypothetical protein
MSPPSRWLSAAAACSCRSSASCLGLASRSSTTSCPSSIFWASCARRRAEVAGLAQAGPGRAARPCRRAGCGPCRGHSWASTCSQARPAAQRFLRTSARAAGIDGPAFPGATWQHAWQPHLVEGLDVLHLHLLLQVLALDAAARAPDGRRHQQPAGARRLRGRPAVAPRTGSRAARQRGSWQASGQGRPGGAPGPASPEGAAAGAVQLCRQADGQHVACSPLVPAPASPPWRAPRCGRAAGAARQERCRLLGRAEVNSAMRLLTIERLAQKEEAAKEM